MGAQFRVASLRVQLSRFVFIFGQLHHAVSRCGHVSLFCVKFVELPEYVE